MYNVHTKMNYLLAILSFVPGAEGDGTTSPSCATANGSINAYRVSLRALMACYFMQLVCKVGQFTYGNKLPACVSFVCLWRRERRGNVALLCNCKQVD